MLLPKHSSACNIRVIYFEMDKETKTNDSLRKGRRDDKGQDACRMWTAPDEAVTSSVQFHGTRGREDVLSPPPNMQQYQIWKGTIVLYHIYIYIVV